MVPWNCREIREFLNQANHYHRFVKEYTAVVKPLTVLTSPKVKWAWNDAQQQDFNNIKQKVGTFLILTNPVKGKPFRLCSDASDCAVGAALEQEGEDGQWHVVAYGSCSLTSAERKWSTTEKECFAVVHFKNHWWHFLLGAKFKVVSDHQAMLWVFGQSEPPMGNLAKMNLLMASISQDRSTRELIARLVAATELVKRTGNVEELREDLAFELILKALDRDESGSPGNCLYW